MNRYRKGANLEREAVREHIAKGAIFAGRFAGSKCGKGSRIKVDVVALYPDVLALEQYKKSKSSQTTERKSFYAVALPETVKIIRNFIEVKT